MTAKNIRERERERDSTLEVETSVISRTLGGQRESMTPGLNFAARDGVFAADVSLRAGESLAALR